MTAAKARPDQIKTIDARNALATPTAEMESCAQGRRAGADRYPRLRRLPDPQTGPAVDRTFRAYSVAETFGGVKQSRMCRHSIGDDHLIGRDDEMEIAPFALLLLEKLHAVLTQRRALSVSHTELAQAPLELGLSLSWHGEGRHVSAQSHQQALDQCSRF